VAEPHAVPSAIGEQVPCLPAIAHDLQVPHDAAPQQNPSVQKPLMHSVDTLQTAPLALRFVHELPRQLYPRTQSVFTAQVVLHAPVPQT
jgi:hypothetical protein